MYSYFFGKEPCFRQLYDAPREAIPRNLCGNCFANILSEITLYFQVLNDFYSASESDSIHNNGAAVGAQLREVLQ